jgi:tetratricopeptide (TPR) repeat protein
MRSVKVPTGKGSTVVVTEFFHHGQITPDGRNVMVVDQRRSPVATRVLQVGPGDWCRVAFETESSQETYEIYYGGEPPAQGTIPAWTVRDGLLLETREFKECNLSQLESVRQAFEASRRIGSGYVETVHHGCNPFALVPGPFLSRYAGTLWIEAAGTYGFVTSSQDCSFLLIDGKVVAEAPGRHGPIRHAKTGARKDVQLKAGAHPFEYYHAAAGPDAMMAAAWAVSPSDAKAPLTPIPSDMFHGGAIGQAPAGPPTMQGEKLMPDYAMSIVGEVPLPENEQTLVEVRFTNTSPSTLTTNSKTLWEFGDGQSSDQASPTHVYLRPGLYTVKLKVTRGGKPFEIANRVAIERPCVTVRDPSKWPKLDDYLPIIQSYDPAKLDPASLLQLVLVNRFKAEQVLAPESAEKPKDKEALKDDAEPREPSPEERQKQKEAQAARETEARKYIAAAVDAGKTALAVEGPIDDGGGLFMEIARMVGPMARDQLGNAQLAGQIWHAASRKVERPEWKAECEVTAADIAVNDLANAKAAKMFLEAAKAHLGQKGDRPLAGRLQRVWGDYCALTGDGANAAKAYREAEAALGSTRNLAQQTAWQGARSRSTEQFLHDGQLERAAEEIRQWQDQFPTARLTGDLTLLYARYWAARGMHEQVVAQADQLLAVNRESAYADQILMLAAESEAKRGRTDRALATLESLVKDYPGSPLVPAAKEKIARIRSGAMGEGKSRGGKAR